MALGKEIPYPIPIQHRGRCPEQINEESKGRINHQRIRCWEN